MTITVVFPTITARRDMARHVAHAYQTTTPRLELVVIENEPTCGSAWQKGVDTRFSGDYLHFAADDLEPWPGWWEPLVEAADAGNQAGAVVYGPDGQTVESAGAYGWTLNTAAVEDWADTEWSPVVFLTRSQWEKVGHIPPELHYATDTWVSARLARHGITPVIRTGSRFTHHNHSAGRGAGMDIHQRNLHDRALYANLIAQP